MKILAAGALSILAFTFGLAQYVPTGPNSVDSGGGGGGTFSLVQFKYNDSVGGAGTSGGTCTATASVCTANVTAIGTSTPRMLIAVALGVSSGATVRSISSINGETWTHCPSCNGSVSFGASEGYLDSSYVLNPAGTETSFTITWSGANTAYNSLGIAEYTYSGPSISFDTSANGSDTSCTTCAGVALTLAGTTETIFQIGIPASGCTAISGSYTNPASFVNGACTAGVINTASGAAPNWTQSPTGVMAKAALAFKGN